jgi:cytochrome c553
MDVQNTPPPLPPALSQQMSVKLLEDLELTTIPEEQKQALLVKISQLVDEEIIYAVMSRLTEQDIADLEQHLDESNPDKGLTDQTFAFLQERVPNLQAVIEDALLAVYHRLKETNDILAS